jgi:hypothetical protein
MDFIMGVYGPFEAFVVLSMHFSRSLLIAGESHEEGLL